MNLRKKPRGRGRSVNQMSHEAGDPSPQRGFQPTDVEGDQQKDRELKKSRDQNRCRQNSARKQNHLRQQSFLLMGGRGNKRAEAIFVKVCSEGRGAQFGCAAILKSEVKTNALLLYTPVKRENHEEEL